MLLRYNSYHALFSYLGGDVIECKVRRYLVQISPVNHHSRRRYLVRSPRRYLVHKIDFAPLRG